MKKSIWLVLWSLWAAFYLQSGNTAGKRGVDAEKPEDIVPVICPALGAAEAIGVNAPPWLDIRKPELVVVVHSIKIGKDRNGRDQFRHDVQKVLYGSYSDKTIELNHLEHNDFYPSSETNVVAAVRSPFAEWPGFNVRYSLPDSDQKAEMAMCQARLDYVTLAARSIFVGTEISADKEFLSTVAVARAIHGTDLKPDSRLSVKSNMLPIGGLTILPDRREQIYFVTPITENEQEGKHCNLITRLPLEYEGAVKEALARRDRYPVRERVVDGRKTLYREITYSGTNAEAIDLLGAHGDGPVSLGFQTLMYRRQEAQPDVVAAIEKEMFEFAPREPERFKRLHQLIKLLKTICGEDKKSDSLVQLADKYISYVKGNPAPLPQYGRVGLEPAAGWGKTEETRTDINRSFTWLLLALGEDRAREKFGAQLLELSEQVKGPWAQEIQVALDGLRLEDAAELAAAMARMKDIKPIRSSTGFRHMNGGMGISVVAFSPDGKLLATAGSDGEVRLLNTADWSPASIIKYEGSIQALAFSPDSRLIYVAGGANKQDPARFNVKTGQIDKTYQGLQKGVFEMALSRDGKTMAASSYFEDSLNFWDADSAEILRTIALPRMNKQFTAAPDGKGIIRLSSDGEWLREPFRGAEAARLSIPLAKELASGASTLPRRNDSMCHLSPDEKYLCSIERELLAENTTLTLWETAGEKKSMARANIRGGQLSRIAFSPDGKFLIAGMRGASNNSIYFFSMPDLKLEARRFFPNPVMTKAVESIAFSPDGKMVAIGLKSPTPYIYKMGSFEKIFLYDGHGDRTTDAFLCKDEKTIRTYGEDRTVCLWDAATMNMIKRIQLPEGYKAIGIRPPDGRYAVCFDAAIEEVINIENPGRSNPAKIVDTDTGKIVSQLELPMGRLRARIHWINDREAVVATWNNLCRFDYMEGKILGCSQIDNSELGNGRGELTEDGQAIFIPPSIGKGTMRIETQTVDVRTCAVKTQKPEQRETIQANAAGLVPDGKHFYVSNPDMNIYDRKTLELVNRKLFKGYRIDKASFSDDGRRYAVTLYASDPAPGRDSKTQCIIRIIETMSGKTLFAISTGPAAVKLPADGKRLLATRSNGNLEIWNLPD
jgi:WD40 repeat protein